jgi:hypothetical protein
VTEKYVGNLVFRLSGFSSSALPEYVEEIWEDNVHVGGPIDRDALLADAQEVLGQQVYVIRDTYTLREWGSSGAALVLDVSTLIGGAAGLVYLFETIRGMIRKRAGREDTVPATVSAEDAAVLSRSWVATCLRVDAGSIDVVEVEATDQGSRVKLETPVGRFNVIRTNDGTRTLKRVRKGPPKSGA